MEALLVAAAGLAAPPPLPAGDGAPAGRFVTGTFTAAAGSRPWRLWVPSGYDAARPAPLVVLLHGCTQDAADIARGTRVTALADSLRVLVLLPEQPEGSHPRKCWNWYEPAHQARDGGEPSLIAGMTRQVMGEWAVDPARVHLAGISAGAAMASLVAVGYPELYASLALHSGLAWKPATTVGEGLQAMANGVADADAQGAAAFAAMGARARPIPVLVAHGAADAVVKPVNGRQAARQWAVTASRAAGATLIEPRVERGSAGGLAYTRTCHLTFAGRCLVEEWMVEGLGHAWSGGSRDGTFTDERGPELMREMLRFFSEHPMPQTR